MRALRDLFLSTAILLATPNLGIAIESMKDELTFEVSLDDQPIGVHRFRISDNGAARVVESNASFDVRILRVPVYRYRHGNTEIWRNGCLGQIESRTDDNGAIHAVNLNKTMKGYTITTPSETRTHEVDCMMSFAYWDQRFLQQSRLLNPQTGELINVEIQPLGESKREIANQTLLIRGFRILAEPPGIDIKVFYNSTDNRWVALESVVEGGRKLRYVLAPRDRLASALEKI